jgi:hypothetical protein
MCGTGRSDGGGDGFETIGDVGDGLDGDTDVDIIGVGYGVDVEFAVANRYTDVLILFPHVDEFGVRIFLQFFGELAKHRKVGACLLGGAFKVLARHNAQTDWNDSSWNPDMDVIAGNAIFVHVHADHAFMEDVNAGKSEGSAEPQSRFGEEEHVRISFGNLE